MFYVVNKRKGFVTHQSKDFRSCEDYVNNVAWQGFGSWEDFEIAENATERDDILRSLKRK